jgi:beta propeller repeat protein
VTAVVVLVLGNEQTKADFPVCTAVNYQSWPVTDGNTVAWTDLRNGNYDIYGYDLDTATEFAVRADTHDQFGPAIEGSIVIWTDLRPGSYHHIYGYDLETDTEFPVSTVNGDKGSTSIQPSPYSATVTEQK